MPTFAARKKAATKTASSTKTRSSAKTATSTARRTISASAVGRTAAQVAQTPLKVAKAVASTVQQVAKQSARKKSTRQTQAAQSKATTAEQHSTLDPFTWPEPPGAFLMALEARAPYELASTMAAMPLLSRAPQGDGHVVVVLPGLATSDASTVPLRKYLQSLGYQVYGWGLGQNRGPRDGTLEKAKAHIQELAQKHADKDGKPRPVSLVGWSLGGVFARELAKEIPEYVRCVITMGTPFSGHPKSTNAWRIFEFASGTRVDDDPALLASLKYAPPVPTTSIYSRTDGIVAWECSVQDAGLGNGGQTENIEVIASHFGIGMNPTTWWAIADRLAQPVGRWKHFDRSGFAQFLFREPGQPWFPFGLF